MYSFTKKKSLNKSFIASKIL